MQPPPPRSWKPAGGRIKAGASTGAISSSSYLLGLSGHREARQISFKLKLMLKREVKLQWRAGGQGRVEGRFQLSCNVVKRTPLSPSHIFTFQRSFPPAVSGVSKRIRTDPNTSGCNQPARPVPDTGANLRSARRRTEPQDGAEGSDVWVTRRSVRLPDVGG